MAKEYIYTLSKSGKVIYKSIEANYVSKEDVDKKVLKETGQDPRLSKHIIECTIRVVGDPTNKKVGRFDKNKRMS
jgi:hypothetical protein